MHITERAYIELVVNSPLLSTTPCALDSVFLRSFVLCILYITKYTISRNVDEIAVHLFCIRLSK